MTNLADLLDRYVRENDFSTVTIHKARDGGFQANLRMEGNSFRVRTEATPSAALAAVLSLNPEPEPSTGVFD